VDPRGRHRSSRRARLACAPDAPPLSSDPERYHAQRSVIAHDLAELARRVAPRVRRTSELEVELSEKRCGRIVVATTQAINGRRVTV